MSEEFLYPEFETKWSNSEIIDMLFDWAKFCMKNKTGDLSNDTAEYFSDKLKAKIAVCSPDTPPTTEEAELWNEVVAKIATADICKNVKPADNVQALIDWKLRIIEKLRPDYELRRRSEQNSEAIEFGYWLHKHDHGSDNHDRIDKLYEQFKQNP